MKRRVVITGLGVCTGVGRGVGAFWDGLTAGRSGISTVTVFDASALPVRIGGQVRELNSDLLGSRFPEAEGERDRKIWLGLDAVTQAIQDAALGEEDLSEAVLVVGVSLETFFLNDVSPLARTGDAALAMRGIMLDPNQPRLQTPLDRLTEILGNHYRFRGGRYTNCSACAAGAQAIGEAFRRIRDGAAEVAVAGASDSVLNPLAMGGFSLLQILSTENEAPQRACRPFDATRRGTVLGEGAAFLVMETLERARVTRSASLCGSPGLRLIAGRLSGHRSGTERQRRGPEHDEGNGRRRVKTGSDRLRQRPRDRHPQERRRRDSRHQAGAGREGLRNTRHREQIHDRPPDRRQRRCGGCGFGLDALYREGSAHHQLVRADPECDLDYVPKASREFDGRTVLSNSFGFGGQNATLVFGKFDL